VPIVTVVASAHVSPATGTDPGRHGSFILGRMMFKLVTLTNWLITSPSRGLRRPMKNWAINPCGFSDNWNPGGGSPSKVLVNGGTGHGGIFGEHTSAAEPLKLKSSKLP